MPIENEVKYILDDPRGELEAHLAEAAESAFDILQAYLGKETRIRRLTDARTGAVEHVFTYKRKMNGAQLEIETPINQADFDALLPTAEIALTKRRYKVADGDIHWDIDFLKEADGATYLALAEAEMPEGMEEPGRVLPCVNEHLLRYVGRSSGYGNRKLADVAYVRKAMKALRTEAKELGAVPGCDPAAYRSAGLSLAA